MPSQEGAETIDFRQALSTSIKEALRDLGVDKIGLLLLGRSKRSEIVRNCLTDAFSGLSNSQTVLKYEVEESVGLGAAVFAYVALCGGRLKGCDFKVMDISQYSCEISFPHCGDQWKIFDSNLGIPRSTHKEIKFDHCGAPGKEKNIILTQSSDAETSVAAKLSYKGLAEHVTVHIDENSILTATLEHLSLIESQSAAMSVVGIHGMQTELRLINDDSERSQARSNLFRLRDLAAKRPPYMSKEAGYHLREHLDMLSDWMKSNHEADVTSLRYKSEKLKEILPMTERAVFVGITREDYREVLPADEFFPASGPVTFSTAFRNQPFMAFCILRDAKELHGEKELLDVLVVQDLPTGEDAGDIVVDLRVSMIRKEEL